MAHTLLEYARSAEPVQRGVIETFLAANQLLSFLPFETQTSGTYIYDLETAIPSVSFRAVNEAVSEIEGTEARMTETVALYGGDIVTDKFLVQTQGVERHSRDVVKGLKSFAHNYFAHVGSGAVGTRGFAGIGTRNSGYGNTVANGGAGGAISLTSLDQAIDSVEGPNRVIFMSRAAKRRISAYARTLGYGILGFTQSALGAQIETYNGLPVIATDPLGSSTNFTTVGASGVIIVASLAPGYITGLQVAPPTATFLGEQDTKPQLKTRVEWYAGLIYEHPRASVSLTGCDDTIAAVA